MKHTHGNGPRELGRIEHGARVAEGMHPCKSEIDRDIDKPWGLRVKEPVSPVFKLILIESLDAKSQ